MSTSPDMTTRSEITSAIIVSASSDIGAALARRWRDRGWKVAGTYRTASSAIAALEDRGVQMTPCDLAHAGAIEPAVKSLRGAASSWDILVLAAGELAPIGPFAECDFAEWNRSLQVNLLAQIEFVRALLDCRRLEPGRTPVVVLFAGGGTNSAPVNFSAYTLAKIALIKMCELLDAEMPDTKFVILGPGWVQTKIHETTLRAGTKAGQAYDQTRERLDVGNFTSMEDVLDCCDWVVAAPRNAVGGRNFSVAHDAWRLPEFIERLVADSELCKLRRQGNEQAAGTQAAVRTEKGITDMTTIMDELLLSLATMPQEHSPSSNTYKLMKRVARAEVERLYANRGVQAVAFGPFGSIFFPYRQMGTVDSLNLFDLDELLLFSFYWQNRKRYRRVADIGANIGIHSLVLSRCGCEVQAFEPDPQHVSWLKETLALNDCAKVELVAAAVSDANGMQEFVRVLDNTTGSHLAGAKSNPYGRLERFTVPTVAIRDIIGRVDFLKIDAEGHERQILLATRPEDWQTTEAIVEVGSPENAAAIFNHFSKSPVRLFAQKSGWSRVVSPNDMPKSYRDGSLFITPLESMPWDGTAASDVERYAAAQTPGRHEAAA